MTKLLIRDPFLAAPFRLMTSRITSISDCSLYARAIIAKQVFT